MPVHRIDLAYDGTRFHGYAKQPNVRTVQGELEAALRPFTGDVETFVGGRTDRGVHAAGQVVSFASDPVDIDRVQRSLNRRLAPEMAVRAISIVDDDFHARFSATGRAYRYQVRDTDIPDPLLAATSWLYGRPLDEALMNDAARHLTGEHDFASFCRKAGDRSTVRDLRIIRWVRERDDLVALDVAASSFCHQMVRSLVALLVEVGRGRVDPEAVPGILAAGDRAVAKGAAPPHGLTLVRIDYD